MARTAILDYQSERQGEGTSLNETFFVNKTSKRKDIVLIAAVAAALVTYSDARINLPSMDFKKSCDVTF